MPANTTRLALPYPVPDDTVDPPRDIKALAEKLDVNTPTALLGPQGSRPAAGVPGRFYYASDIRVLYFDDGAAWALTTGSPHMGLRVGTGAALPLGSSWTHVTNLNPRIQLVRGQAVEIDATVAILAQVNATVETFCLVEPMTPGQGPYVLAPSSVISFGVSSGSGSTIVNVAWVGRWVCRAGHDGEHRIGMYATAAAGGSGTVDPTRSVLRWRAVSDIDESTGSPVSQGPLGSIHVP